MGDPLPTVALSPFTTNQLQIAQVGGRVDLVFPVPPGPLGAVEVYRRANAPVDEVDGVELVALISGDDLRQGSNGGYFTFQDRPGTIRQTWFYALRFISSQGRRSDFSRSVHSEPLAPAHPPEDLSAEVREDRIIIRWQAPKVNIDGSSPPRLVGYLVNSEHFVTETEYVDQEFQFGPPRTYRLQAVARRVDPLILSEFSDTLTVVPRDVFPPAAPKNVTALLKEGQIQVLWDANKELDLRGYFVYKGQDPNRLEKSSPLITINRYTDDQVGLGNTWYYQVSAMDESGNQSEKSEAAIVTSKR